ncbi:DUF5047 domain-containing protein [Cellulosimicrobium sp. Marseille-Q8652]
MVSDAYRDALTRPHRVVFRATVTRGGVPLYDGRALPVTGGSVTVSSRAATRRRCSLTIAPRLPGRVFEDEPTFPLERTTSAPIGTDGQELTLRQGLVYAGGRIEWCPIGVFRIDDVDGSLLSQSGVRVSGVSREAWVLDDRFPAPRTLQGPSAVAIIRDLILESFSAAEVAILTRRDRRVGPTVVERDRWADGVVKLADSIACVVYADASGRFVIADAPTLDSAPAWRFQAGPGGVLLDVNGHRSRRPVSNRVVVTGTTPRGATAPVWGQAVDDQQGSLTRFGDPSTGAWGRKTRHFSIPSLTNGGQCIAVARAKLAQVTGAGTSLDLTSVPLFQLDGGDVVDVVTDHSRVVQTISRHIVDDISLEVAAGGRFTATTRDLGEVSG